MDTTYIASVKIYSITTPYTFFSLSSAVRFKERMEQMVPEATVEIRQKGGLAA